MLTSDIDVVASVGHGEDGEAPLTLALEGITAGDANVLLLTRLADAAGSLRELTALLDWLAAAGADLVALDVGLDTVAPAGQGTLAVVRELARWEREPPPGRPPRGRPGLARRSPELAARIAAMRERGMSLRAIADALNEEGVPTHRGGALWRPSSVQSALGYRRPGPPPPPGAPALPPVPPRRAPHAHRHACRLPAGPAARGEERGR
jgi:hypothetical protein